MSEAPIIQTPENENPSGHIPLKFFDRSPDGRPFFIDPYGEPKRADFEIGPSQGHIDAFIEYERTFGRGIAYDFTHAHLYDRLAPDANFTYVQRNDIPMTREQADAAIIEYEGLADIASNSRTLLLGTDDDLRGLVRMCRKFRSSYPMLYTDVGRKKFVIKDE